MHLENLILYSISAVFVSNGYLKQGYLYHFIYANTGFGA